MKLLIPALLMSVSFANAEINKSGIKAPTSKKEFCANVNKPDYFKSLFYNRENLISFTNRGGIANGGVCWWHSMLTRSATYLVVYRPELPRAGRAEANTILRQLSSNKGVVEIPGYSNFSDFTSDHSDLVQATLDNWQLGDGGLGFGWVRGLSGNSRVSAPELSSMMDETYGLVKNSKKVAYQKLQIEGIEAHAWLVVDMNKTENGYDMDVVDSNTGGVRTVQYSRGMTNLPEYSAVPYTSRNGSDYSSYKWAQDQYCKRGMSANDLDARSGGNNSMFSN